MVESERPADLERKYGFAGQVAQMTDAQLLATYDAERKTRGSGAARTYFMYCLQEEIKNRSLIDG